MTAEPTRHSGRRVLLVEDEVMVAMYIEDILGDLGCSVIGVAINLEQGLALAHSANFDFAVLDINLGGQMSFPVADLLRQRNIRFLFISGYTSDALVEEYRNEVRLQKPIRIPDLTDAIARLQLG